MESKLGRIPLEVENPVAGHPEPAKPITTNAAPATSVEGEDLEEKIVGVLRTCYDPEIPVNIYELGLIYDIVIQPEGAVEIRMTLTSPACPVAGSLPGDVQSKVKSIPGIKEVKVELVWDPPWTPDRMSDAAKLQLGMF